MQKSFSFFKNGQTCEVDIKLQDGRLSICGTIYEGKELRKDERNLICCGQCVDMAKEFIPARFYQIWDRWHLNDMRAGTPAQTEVLRDLFAVRPGSDYDKQCEFLKEKGLLVDNGYVYGSAWLREELPQDVVEYIEAL